MIAISVITKIKNLSANFLLLSFECKKLNSKTKKVINKTIKFAIFMKFKMTGEVIILYSSTL